MKLPRHRVGLTLVEVLVATAILIVLSGLVFAISKAAISRAQLTSCASNLRQVGQASFLYLADNADQLPPFVTESSAFGLGNGNFQTVAADLAGWKKALLPYAGSNEVFYCPMDSARKSGVELWSISGSTTTVETSYRMMVVPQYYFWNGRTVQSKAFSTIEPKFPFMSDLGIIDRATNRIHTFHGDKSNVLFHDGSTKTVPASD
ncbi:MAG: type II secretion system GspH family protein [Fimbriimonadaceae bacterium]|jgi:prepilin-type processing-associated H-X9-DG protein|nr:type II secretion system GspH family protein [Fimbriimonadaceae bacterium]